jgi:arylsulfatase A-like enzyme
LGFGNDFDRLPPPPIKSAAMREITESFHSAALTNDVGFATRLAPYLLEQISPTRFGQTHSIFPPKLSFGQAKELLKGLEEPYFLWVHTYAPHFPYLPEPPFLKKFLPSNELRTHSDFANLFDLKGYSYTTAKQPLIDKARLRYDEWIAEADFAFGDFMATLHASPSWGKTAMLVSSDHGESFTSGYLGHGGPTQLRPIVHVPLLIHEPGQSTRATISTVADQTRLAPTILDLTQLNRPSWMDGQSLMQLIRGDNIPASSLAFTEYFEGNSAFKPIRHGSVGVLDGQYQYVFDLDQGRGALYDLNASSPQSDDLSGKFPQMAALLHAEIAKRFPYLPEA